MKTPLNILLLEDSEADAKLVAHELEKLGHPFRLARVQSEAELRHELDIHRPDVILSDHGLPAFSGFTALAIVRQTEPTLPFIFVSGSNDQQMVVDMYDRGATDYVFKHDIHGLVPAVRHALEPPTEEPKTETQLPHPELELELPAPALPQPFTFSSQGHLHFCPKCRRAWDDAGQLVGMEKYLSDHFETAILRQICAACSPPMPY